jgi:hypothetical protein
VKAAFLLIVTLAVFVAVQMILIAVHEAGHLLAGWLVGFRWLACKVGPFELTREDGRWRRVSPESVIDGFVRFSPQDNLASRPRWAAVLLAGSAANGLLGLGLLAFFFHQPPVPQQGEGWLFGIAVFSLVVGLVNLVPFAQKGHASDGLWLLILALSAEGFRETTVRLEQNRAEAARYEGVMALRDGLTSGRRPRSWDQFRVRSFTELRDGSRSEAVACYYAYLWAEDSGDPTAWTYLNRAVALRDQAPDIRDMLLTERAYWSALHERDAGSARHWIAQVAEDYAASSPYWRAMAALSLADGDRAEAAQHARRSREAIAPDEPSDRYLLERLLTVGALTEADGRLANTVSSDAI